MSRQITEEEMIKIKRLYTHVRVKWSQTQPSDRYPMHEAKRFIEGNDHNLADAKNVFIGLKHLAIWLKKMEEYDWSQEGK